MSVVIEICKPLLDVTWIPPTNDFDSAKATNDLNNGMSDDDFNAKWFGYFMQGDVADHNDRIRCIDLRKHRDWNRRYNKHIRELKNHFAEYVITYGEKEHYPVIPYESVLCRQGYFFTHKFFSNHNTFYIAYRQDHMMRLLKQFIDPVSHDTRGEEAYHACVDTFKDGMIFMLSW